MCQGKVLKCIHLGVSVDTRAIAWYYSANTEGILRLPVPVRRGQMRLW